MEQAFEKVDSFRLLSSVSNAGRLQETVLQETITALDAPRQHSRRRCQSPHR